MLRSFAHPVACCWMFLPVVAQSLKPVKIFSQQLPTFLLLRDRRSVAQQCWIRLHSSSNIVGATHAHYTWFTKTYFWLVSFPLCTAGPKIVGSCCIRLHTTTNTHPTTPNIVVASICTQLKITFMSCISVSVTKNTGIFSPFLFACLFILSMQKNIQCLSIKMVCTFFKVAD